MARAVAFMNRSSKKASWDTIACTPSVNIPLSKFLSAGVGII
jgi:hypothetical protein